ncbi:hypothetical protein [Sedimenticola selenatireducens]|uniref:hypothetical protein n=1 Tax=Sedimenticola selenatireducens TaxID=191960 RepID=UPI0004BA6D23|nr:hypothetical protein [Sedimenticola selenatireducens]
MQRVFHSAFCLTLVMTSALADGSHNPPGYDSSNGWRPIDTPTEYNTSQPQADITGQSQQPYPSSPGYAAEQYPDPTPGYYSGEGFPGGPGATGPYDYYQGQAEPYIESPYYYPSDNFVQEWGDPTAPAYPYSYYPAPGYNYPYYYQEGTAPAYNPYAPPQDYRYPPVHGYGQESYTPPPATPGYENNYFQGYGNSGYDTRYGTTAPLAPQQPMQMYDGAAPTPVPPTMLEPYPAYAQPPAYPQGQKQPADQTYSPPPPVSSDRDNRAQDWAQQNSSARDTPATQYPGYRINGAPAVFRPWTDPADEPSE